MIKIEAYEGHEPVATTYINGNPNTAPLEDALDETGHSRQPGGQIELHTPDFSYRATSSSARPR